MDLGLLIADGFENAVIDEEDDGRPRAVEREGNRGFGYHSSTQGWVSADQPQLKLFRPDIEAVFRMLLKRELRLLSGGVRSLDKSGFVWDVGSIYQHGKLTSLWFARRLADRNSSSTLEQAHSSRPPAQFRIILTSTAPERHQLDRLAKAIVIPIDDVLSGHRPDEIDMGVLHARSEGRPAQPSHQRIALSPDNRVLFIDGEEVVRLTGPKQGKLLRLMVDAHEAGRPMRASEMLNQAHSAATSFDQAFGRKWNALRQHLSSKDGIWEFVL